MTNVHCTVEVADQGFFEGLHQPIIWQFVCRILHKNEGNRIRGRGCPWYPLPGIRQYVPFVYCRVEGSQMEDRTTDKMWLVKHLEVIRQSVVEDMKVVKVHLVKSYHGYF